MSKKGPFTKTAENLKNAMKAAHTKAADLARRSGIDKTMISKYVNGHNIPTIKNAEIMAPYLGVSPGFLLGVDDESFSTAVPQYYKALSGLVKGKPVFKDEGGLMFKSGKKPEGDGSSRFFIFHVADDAMGNARIFRGDCVIVKTQDNADNGDIAVLALDGTLMIRRVLLDNEDGSISLTTDDPESPPVLISNEEHERLQIFGKVIRVQSEPI